MAEFCVKCWNELHDTDYPDWIFFISKECDFCEGCAQWVPVIEGYWIYPSRNPSAGTVVFIALMTPVVKLLRLIRKIIKNYVASKLKKDL